MRDQYLCLLTKHKRKLKLRLEANDSNHAQAQGLDLRRAFSADSVVISYGTVGETQLSKLISKLTLNDFNYDKCEEWQGPYLGGYPCMYAFQERYYIRPLILKYLDIPDDSTLRMTCGNPHCTNPYHFSYGLQKNAKLSSGDVALVLAYRRQGMGAAQIAEALNVHRSTIYRTLKNERIHPRSPSDGSSPNK